ncbi:MAG: tyrosine recombinase XerD [Coriobacteriia bacterium]|nr:tyrosine recombinase XerD [Coriobacteriia bacterium]
MLTQAITEYHAHLSAEKGASPHTIEAYLRDLAQYETFLAERLKHSPVTAPNLDDIARADIVEFIAYLRSRGFAPSTIERKLSAIRNFHAFTYREGIASHNPATKLPTRSKTQTLPDVLSVDEAAALFHMLYADSTPAGLRNVALIETLYGCGLRASEVCGLDILDIDFDAGALRVTGKGNKQRIAPVGERAAAALRRYLDAGRSHLHPKRSVAPATSAVFLTTRGARIYREAVYNIVRVAGAQAGLTRSLHPHTLRHSYATHMLEGGADLRSLQEMLGHADLSTTQIYTHVDQSHLRQEYLLSHPRAQHTPEHG